MSVDIFGRQLGEIRRIRGQASTRGPPGIGFKLTVDGHFDINQKRLCNVGYPADDTDAIPLQILKNVIKEQVDHLNEEISSTRVNITNHNVMIQSVIADRRKYKKQNDTFTDTDQQMTSSIIHLDKKAVELDQLSNQINLTFTNFDKRIEELVEKIKELNGRVEKYHNDFDLSTSLWFTHFNDRLEKIENEQRKNHSS